MLAIEILGGLAMLPYGLCLTMRVTNGRAPPPDEKGNVRRGRMERSEARDVLFCACRRAGLRAPAASSSAQPVAPPPPPPPTPTRTRPPAHPFIPVQVSTSLSYHIRVVVPCYKEPLDVIQKTFTAALVAPIPTNCSRTGEPSCWRAGGGRLPPCDSWAARE